MPPTLCTFCNKECKSSDSRPYPNLKSDQKIHIRCHIKKTVRDKQTGGKSSDSQESGNRETLKSGSSLSSPKLVEKLEREQDELRKAAEEARNKRVILEKQHEAAKSKNESGQFFFDIKAGIAKPSEKRRYLHHRNLCEIAARYDDQGFQEETSGRAYNHEGKELDTLGDSDEDEDNNDKIDHKKPSYSDDRKRLRLDERRDPESKRHQDPKTREYRPGQHKSQSGVSIGEKNPCWFCLSSPKVEKHLIVAIGDYCYLAIAKGGLVDEHFLILPIEHMQTLNTTNLSEDLIAELDKFKRSLVAYFKEQSKAVVFFERNFKTVHWQLQAVPVDSDDFDSLPGIIKLKSVNYFAKADYIDIPDNCSLCDIIPPGAPYFYWQVEPAGKAFVCQIKLDGSFFPIQFGRMVLADPALMNCQDKVDWKSCVKEEQAYVELVAKIKNMYRKYDFTND